MHLDERLEKSREVIGKQLAVGQKKVSSAFNNLWAEMEAIREAQRAKRESVEGQSLPGEKHAPKCKNPIAPPSDASRKPPANLPLTSYAVPKAPDLSQAQANLHAASTRATAYLSSWGAWASEKKKGWAASKSTTTTPVSSPPPTSPTPSDIKRAEDLKEDRELDGFVAISSARAATPRRESVFFDADKEEDRTKNTAKDVEST